MLGAPALGTLDSEILIWCEENDFILVTNNRKSMPAHLQEHLATRRYAAGIFTLSENMNSGETIDELLLIASASSSEEYRNLIIPLLPSAIKLTSNAGITNFICQVFYR